MRNAQTEAFDKLYAAEFKRFIAGKIVRCFVLLLSHQLTIFPPSPVISPRTHASVWSTTPIGTTEAI